MENSGGERSPASTNAMVPMRKSMGSNQGNHPDSSPWVRPSLGTAGEVAADDDGASQSSQDITPEPVLRVIRNASGNSSASSGTSKGGQDGGAEALARRKSAVLWAGDDSDALNTGVRKTWLGLDRRSHRFLGIAAGLYMYVCVFLLLFFSFFFAPTGCLHILAHKLRGNTALNVVEFYLYFVSNIIITTTLQLSAARRIMRTILSMLTRFLHFRIRACRYLCYVTIVSANVGFLFFNFIVAWVFCVVGCAGCCCVIPPDPDDGDDE